MMVGTARDASLPTLRFLAEIASHRRAATDLVDKTGFDN
jgi:hypothetical protein